MTNYNLEIEQASAVYDPETQIATIIYRGALTADVNLRVYEWLENLYNDIGTEKFIGQIFDFRQVTDFDRSNLITARRNSNRINMALDTSHIPVALLINDPYHEEMLRAGMRISPENIRKHIVWTEDDAHAFIQQYNTE